MCVCVSIEQNNRKKVRNMVQTNQVSVRNKCKRRKKRERKIFIHKNSNVTQYFALICAPMSRTQRKRVREKAHDTHTGNVISFPSANRDVPLPFAYVQMCVPGCVCMYGEHTRVCVFTYTVHCLLYIKYQN